MPRGLFLLWSRRDRRGKEGSCVTDFDHRCISRVRHRSAHFIIAMREEGCRVHLFRPPIAQLAGRGNETRVVLRLRTLELRS
jgi:hypothetical protein